MNLPNHRGGFKIGEYPLFQAPWSDARRPRHKKLPSEYFHQQVYSTFFNDTVGGHMLSWWGADNCMWSNDLPHGNSTWTHSRQVVARDLGDLPAALRAKLVRENVARLYNIPVPSPVENKAASNGSS